MLCFYCHSAQSQNKIEFSLGFSGNKAYYKKQGISPLTSSVSYSVDSKFGYGVHARVLTYFDGAFDFSISPGLIYYDPLFKRPDPNSDLTLNVPLLLHCELYKNLELQLGLNYDYFINRTFRAYNNVPSDGIIYPNHHFVSPTVGLAYVLKRYVEFNLSYNFETSKTNDPTFIGLGFTEPIVIKDRYIQFTIFCKDLWTLGKGDTESNNKSLSIDSLY